jgi:hypothetical protein
MDAIHGPGVFGWVKQSDIAFMHPQARKPAVSGPGSEDGAGVGVPLDGEDGGMAEDKIGVKPAASPCEKMSSSHWFSFWAEGPPESSEAEQSLSLPLSSPLGLTGTPQKALW